jgi:hypothetical protein
MRDRRVDCAVNTKILQAADENKIYKGFRWAKLDRALPDDTFQALPPASNARDPAIGLVAMITLDGARVDQVFPDQGAAAANRRFKGTGSISTAMKKGVARGGFRFRLWKDVPKPMQDAFLASGGVLPAPRGHYNQHAMEKLDAETGAMLEPFTSVAAVIRKYPVARKALEAAAANGTILKGFRWRRVGAPVDGDA